MRKMWPLLLNDGKHEAQANESLDLLSELYGDEFAADAAQKSS